jgi:hypothetical protein
MSMNYSYLGSPTIQVAPEQAVSALTTGNSDWVTWGRAEGMVEVSGTFDGATLTMYARHKDRTSTEIQVTLDDGTNISMTTNRIFYVRLPSTYELQFRTSGGGASQSINVFIN